MRLVLQTDNPAALPQTIDVLRKRVAEAGDRFTTVEPLDADRIEVLAPDIADPTGIGGYLTRPGVLTLNLVDSDADPAGYEPGVERSGRVALPDDTSGGQLRTIFVDPIVVRSDIASANQVADGIDLAAIDIELSASGAQRMAKATSQNIGRSMAIVLDDRIVSAPTIQTPIADGKLRITGNFIPEEARDIVRLLRAGALPAHLRVVETSTFGTAPP